MNNYLTIRIGPYTKVLCWRLLYVSLYIGLSYPLQFLHYYLFSQFIFIQTFSLFVSSRFRI